MEGETTIEKLHRGRDNHIGITWRERQPIEKLHGGRDNHIEIKWRERQL